MKKYLKMLKKEDIIRLVLSFIIAAFAFIPWHNPLSIRGATSDFYHLFKGIQVGVNFFYFFFYMLIPFLAYFVPLILFATHSRLLRILRSSCLAMLTTYALIGIFFMQSYGVWGIIGSVLFLFISMFCLVMDSYHFLHDQHDLNNGPLEKSISAFFAGLHLLILFIPIFPTNEGNASYVSFVQAMIPNVDEPLMIPMSLIMLILSTLYFISIFFSPKWVRLARLVVASALLCFDSFVLLLRPQFLFPLFALASLFVEIFFLMFQTKMIEKQEEKGQKTE